MGLLMPSTPHNISGRRVGFGLVAVRRAFLVSGLQAFEQALRLLHVPLNHAPVQNAQEVSPARNPPLRGSGDGMPSLFSLALNSLYRCKNRFDRQIIYLLRVQQLVHVVAVQTLDLWLQSLELGCGVLNHSRTFLPKKVSSLAAKIVAKPAATPSASAGNALRAITARVLPLSSGVTSSTATTELTTAPRAVMTICPTFPLLATSLAPAHHIRPVAPGSSRCFVRGIVPPT